eukprot:TRINITY_DN5221_c0_g1_i1.p1 TRINITY_DN5221_c0_g1~~TRINITY_DN5221_c0_g1_i1.p1  ORF type:complete len:762 (-),score=58.14 TRINITY_DN5221_c0_g1_i1:10-2295(-)
MASDPASGGSAASDFFSDRQPAAEDNFRVIDINCDAPLTEFGDLLRPGDLMRRRRHGSKGLRNPDRERPPELTTSPLPLTSFGGATSPAALQIDPSVPLDLAGPRLMEILERPATASKGRGSRPTSGAQSAARPKEGPSPALVSSGPTTLGSGSGAGAAAAALKPGRSASPTLSRTAPYMMSNTDLSSGANAAASDAHLTASPLFSTVLSQRDRDRVFHTPSNRTLVDQQTASRALEKPATVPLRGTGVVPLAAPHQHKTKRNPANTGGTSPRDTARNGALGQSPVPRTAPSAVSGPARTGISLQDYVNSYMSSESGAAIPAPLDSPGTEIPEGGISLYDYVSSTASIPLGAPALVGDRPTGAEGPRPANRGPRASVELHPTPSASGNSFNNRPVTRQKLPKESLDLFLPERPATSDTDDDVNPDGADQKGRRRRPYAPGSAGSAGSAGADKPPEGEPVNPPPPAGAAPNVTSLFVGSGDDFGAEPEFPTKAQSGAFKVNQVDWDSAFARPEDTPSRGSRIKKEKGRREKLGRSGRSLRNRGPDGGEDSGTPASFEGERIEGGFSEPGANVGEELLASSFEVIDFDDERPETLYEMLARKKASTSPSQTDALQDAIQAPGSTRSRPNSGVVKHTISPAASPAPQCVSPVDVPHIALGKAKKKREKTEECESTRESARSARGEPKESGTAPATDSPVPAAPGPAACSPALLTRADSARERKFREATVEPTTPNAPVKAKDDVGPGAASTKTSKAVKSKETTA